jgi:hypothetical protein
MRAALRRLHGRRRWLATACASFYLFLAFVHAANRPIPEVVNLTVFARQEDRQLELLVRVPLAAVKEVQFPTRPDGDSLQLDLTRSMLPGAARYWIAPTLNLLADGTLLGRPEVAATRISISADQSFDAYESAIARLNGPELPDETTAFWRQVWFDMRLLYDLPTPTSAVAIEPLVSTLGVHVSTNLTIVGGDTPTRTLTFDGDPGLIYLAPRWIDATRQFFVRGLRSIVTNADVLLLLCCLALPFRRVRTFVPVIAAFAGALVLGLILVLAGLTPDRVWTQPLVDVLAGTVILLAALANVAGRVTPRRRALFALGAGCIFGLMAAADLRQQIQFSGAHVLAGEMAFPAGAVVATAGVAALLVPVVSFLFSFARVESLERIIVSALAADTAWGWIDERWTRFRTIPLQFNFDGDALATGLRVLAVVVLVGGGIWFLSEWLKARGFDQELTPESQPKTAS